MFFSLRFPAFALDPERSIFQYNCQTWRRANGLPANSINAIAQSPDGRVWLGTSKGLVYFDGIEFHLADLSGEKETEGKAIISLARRSAGGLWVGMDPSGVGFFDGKHFSPAIISQENVLSEKVHAVQESPDGTLLLAASGAAGRLAQDSSFTSLLPTNNADVFTIVEDSQGRVWLGTAESGLYFWQDGNLHSFPDKTLGEVIISSFAIDHAGQIWVGGAHGSEGLRCYGADFQRKTLTESLPQAKALLVDSHGVLWIGTSGAGLVRYQKGAFTYFRKQDGLASDRVLSLAESDDGSLWVGTVDGLSQLTDAKFPIFSIAEGLVSEACLAVAASPKGGVWVGTANGMSLYRDGQFSNFGLNGGNGFYSRWVKRILPAQNGDVYLIGARKNLDRFSGDRVALTWTNSTWPRALAEDSRGVIVALGDNLMRIENDQLVPLRLADGRSAKVNWVNHIMVARDDSIWVAANDGVSQIKDGVLQNMCAKNGLPQTIFAYLCEDDDGGVWASQTTGLVRFKNGTARPVTQEQGLHENFVCVMVADKLGNFWMDSNRGIFRVRQRELNAVADGTAQRVNCTVFDGEEIVKSTDKMDSEYSACRSLDGRLWFSSAKGVIMVDPVKIAGNSKAPPVSITGVRINGKEYEPDKNPVLDPGAGNLEFNYSALDYIAPQKIQYRYRLDGFETHWVEAGSRRTAFYTNIKPGRYQFQVQACNSDGVWNDTRASFALELPRRYYETMWFKASYALAALGLLIYFWWAWHLRQKQTQLQEANALMEVKVLERTVELADANTTLRAEVEERKRAQAETERLQNELLDASRQAGQAEVASSVLHNVGNVLNSVNVSASLIANRVRNLRSANLAKAVEMIHEHHEDLGHFLTEDKRGSKIPLYLDQVARHLAGEQEGLSAELKSLCENVEHIKEIVAMQQTYARVSGVSEKLPVADLVECALKMHSSSFDNHGITLVRKFQTVPPATVDRHKVLQILVNLLKNARQACDEGGAADKKIVVSISPVGKDAVSIGVTDNGVGVSAENLTRIFSHGFTTRKDGHGFGLHSAALAAREMGGSLAAFSDGTGKGTTFILHLPLQAQNKERMENAATGSARPE